MRALKLLTVCLGLTALGNSSCSVTREQVEAIGWHTNMPYPEHICELHPDIQWGGFYRVLDNGKMDFQSFCDKEASEYMAFKREDLEALLKLTIPRRGNNVDTHY